MAGDHARNVAGMHAAARCGARGSGAPRGNRNALKSGLYTAESLELRRHVAQLIRDSRKIIEEL